LRSDFRQRPKQKGRLTGDPSEFHVVIAVTQRVMLLSSSCAIGSKFAIAVLSKAVIPPAAL